MSVEPKESKASISNILLENPFDLIIPSHRELIPDLSEVYELELAFYENRILSDDELIRNGAYFARVGDQLTRHFLMCSGEPLRLPKHSSSRLRSFFSSNQFRTGYGTHGLFPYRGKFHPQMIKGLINSMGLKPGNVVLDPMMGSGTVLIEASLMGIDSIGFDISPFCEFMTETKLDALEVSLTPIKPLLSNPLPIFEFFRDKVGAPIQGSKIRDGFYQNDLFSHSNVKARTASISKSEIFTVLDDEKIYNFLLLAYLDAAGYSQRSNRKSPYEQFSAILERYYFVAEKIQRVLNGIEDQLGTSLAKEGDARTLLLDDSSIDGIIFSPPYSFAIDYLENDSFHLGYLGVDIDVLREDMVGLRGKSRLEKYNNYVSDMDKVISECSRVLRPGGICSIVVGTNNNQLSKILKVPPDQVRGIDELFVESASKYQLKCVRRISRKITGMANTMRTEYILMLERF